MNMDEHEFTLRNVVGAAYEVSNALGAGFLEKVYHRAMARELACRGLAFRTNVSCPIDYKGERVGEYFADMIVEDCLLVELKCAESFADEHLAQCLNYLKASRLRHGVLINFQHPKVEWRRVILG